MAFLTEVWSGTKVRFSAVLADTTDKPYDPASLTFTYGVPTADDTVAPTTYTYPASIQIVRDSIGHYHVDVDTTGMAPPESNVVLTAQFVDPAGGLGFGDVLVKAPPF